MEFSRQKYWSELPSLLQGIFLIQGSNLGLPHCRQFLYHLSHQENPHEGIVTGYSIPSWEETLLQGGAWPHEMQSGDVEEDKEESWCVLPHVPQNQPDLGWLISARTHQNSQPTVSRFLKFPWRNKHSSKNYNKTESPMKTPCLAGVQQRSKISLRYPF